MPPKPVTKSSSTGSLSVIAPPNKNNQASKLPTTTTTTGSLSVFKQSSEVLAASTKREEEKTNLLIQSEITSFNYGNYHDKLKYIEDVLNLDAKSCKIKLRVLNDIIVKDGITSEIGDNIITQMTLSIYSNTDKNEVGLLLFQLLLVSLNRQLEPYGIELLSRLLELQVDKNNNVRELSALLCKNFCEIICPQSFRLLFPIIIAGIEHENWKIKVGALAIIKIIAPKMSKQLSSFLPKLIPKVSDCIQDSKKQVQTIALEAMNIACLSITNDDIRPLVPQLVSVIAKPEESLTTLNMLLETTFVATVDAPVLALIAPLLGKSLKNRSSIMKRKASKVIDIMCRLVQNPSDVAPFKDLLLPYLDKVIDEIVDAEVCEVAKAAREVLLKALGEGKAKLENTSLIFDQKEVQTQLLQALHSVLPKDINKASNILCKYISTVTTNLILYDVDSTSSSNSSSTSTSSSNDDSVVNWREKIAVTLHSDWKNCTVPYLTAIIMSKKDSMNSDGVDIDSIVNIEEKGSENHSNNNHNSSLDQEFNNLNIQDNIEKLSMLYRTSALDGVKDMQDVVDEDSANLCNIEFSLAFGGKILLHNTFLRLGKGRRYGVMGKNGAGKTTLLTNIGTGNIEGLPTSLKTVYVQHDDASEDGGVSLIDELVSSKEMVASNVKKADAIAALKNINFTDTMLESPRSCLSGGWKMKLLIIKASLAGADILLLDEPTNHLDTASVNWLVSYIVSQKDVTCMIVSHDTGFLDRVLTDVIHYENKKLVYYHGNLTHFVSIHPEAKYYYELEGSTLAFKFPIPGRLDGINSSTKSILKMENVSYTYPGALKPTLTNVNVKVCLGSRIAVLGPNGAGKSTLIKMLVQETKPDEGSGKVTKHINLRIAYVAQHSFHHVEQHLDTSPVDYMKWRFSGGVDKEDLARPDKKLTEEEEVLLKTDRKYGDVEAVHGRRKNGHTMEYECTFVGQVHGREPNKYIPVEKMIEMGLEKLVQQCDSKVAAMAAGLDIRPLLTAEIQGHLNDFNLDPEFGTHGTIKRLSGGQKVKLVLAAAMWNKPHVIILDEPTNYLDREALGALTQAIKSFAGGVVIISHNKEFTDAICNEDWLVNHGRCDTSGGSLEDEKVKTKNVKKSKSAGNLPEEGDAAAAGCTNKTIQSEILLNPRTLEAMSKKQMRLLEKCAQTAGMTPKDYLNKINFKSPEWKWL